MGKISAAQQRKIHVLAKQIGMDDDLLHEYVYMVVGKESLRQLSTIEAVKVIDGLDSRNGYERGDRASYRQEHFIRLLMEQLGWVDENGQPDKSRLDGFCRRQCGLDDSRWMTRKAASKVIEGLKNLKERQKKEQMA